MSWGADLQRLAKKGQHDVGQLARAVKIELFSRVVLQTRVDTGRLKGNWQIQDNTKPQGEVERKDHTELDDMDAASEANILNGSTKDSITYFVNNLPYAKKYEELDAMVATSVRETRQIVKEQIRKIRR